LIKTHTLKLAHKMQERPVIQYVCTLLLECKYHYNQFMNKNQIAVPKHYT